MYGRVSQLKCISNYIGTTKCVSQIEKTIQTVGNECNHKKTCTMNVDTNHFNDKFEQIYKYLDIKYECIMSTK
jgi:hypothetical protein